MVEHLPCVCEAVALRKQNNTRCDLCLLTPNLQKKWKTLRMTLFVQAREGWSMCLAPGSVHFSSLMASPNKQCKYTPSPQNNGTIICGEGCILGRHSAVLKRYSWLCFDSYCSFIIYHSLLTDEKTSVHLRLLSSLLFFFFWWQGVTQAKHVLCDWATFLIFLELNVQHIPRALILFLPFFPTFNSVFHLWLSQE